PALIWDMFQAAPGKLFYRPHQFQQGSGVRDAYSNVVDLAGSDGQIFPDCRKGTHQGLNAEHIPHLTAIAINHHRLLLKGRVQEMGDPALVFRAELAWAGNTGHAENDRGQPVNTVEIVNVLVRRPFRTAIRRMK